MTEWRVKREEEKSGTGQSSCRPSKVAKEDEREVAQKGSFSRSPSPSLSASLSLSLSFPSRNEKIEETNTLE